MADSTLSECHIRAAERTDSRENRGVVAVFGPVVDSMVGSAKAGVEALDAARRRTGRLLAAAGWGPQTTPSDVVDVAPGVRLHTYPGGGSPVLLVPAPIKRWYLWDLEPAVSVVAHVRRRGLRPYLVEWTDQPGDDPALGLAHHADTLLGACLDAVNAQTGTERVAVAGHSLGGTLATILAARRPERVAALAVLEAPLRFGGAAGSFAPLVATTPPSTLDRLAHGGVPGAFLDVVSATASPREFASEPRVDRLRSLADPAALRTHLRVLRWASDEFRMPGALFRDVVEQLYRDDAFARGTLEIAGQQVGPATLRSPLTTVFAPRSAVIPPDSVVPVHEAAAAPDKLLLEYAGDVGVALQHVGVLVGRTAHRDLWPRILDRFDPPA
jgi:polyhydroxyalkanoate synthase